ncbi:unnamed protein product [Ixodes pacificus]
MRVSGGRHERWANRSSSTACNPTSPPPLEPSSPEASELPESEGSPDSSVGQEVLDRDLLLLADVAWDVEPLYKVTTARTDTANSNGPLQLLLSATDGARGSTQVTHIPQADKVTHPEKPWARSCGFLEYESMKTSEHQFQDLCCVTATVFTVLLNMLPEQRYRSSDVTKEDRLVLFLLKLNLGISLTALGAIFSIRKSTASRVFRVTLDCLSVKLANWVFVPPRQTIKDTLPVCFTEQYPKCTFIIDCTEVRTETPTDAGAQHYLYFHYKGCYTLKWLVVILPNGMVSFLSGVYGGRHSDSFILVILDF